MWIWMGLHWKATMWDKISRNYEKPTLKNTLTNNHLGHWYVQLHCLCAQVPNELTNPHNWQPCLSIHMAATVLNIHVFCYDCDINRFPKQCGCRKITMGQPNRTYQRTHVKIWKLTSEGTLWATQCRIEEVIKDNLWYIKLTMLIVGPSRNNLLMKCVFADMGTLTFEINYKDIQTHTTDLDSKYIYYDHHYRMWHVNTFFIFISICIRSISCSESSTRI